VHAGFNDLGNLKALGQEADTAVDFAQALSPYR
jgi:hypothetical protein